MHGALPVCVGVRMTESMKRTRPRRTCKLESRVTPEVYRDVEDYAVEHGYTLSTAVNCVLLEWKARRDEAARAEDL